MATRKRNSVRGWLTRATRSLMTLVAEQADHVALTDGIAAFDKRLAALDVVQEEMELELDGDELTADIESASDFRDECRKQRLAAVRLLGVGDDDARSSTSSHSSTSPSLPKLELPSFSGDVLKWMGFWDQFSAVVDQSDLPEVSKFVYLQSLLTDDAKMSVKGLSLSEGNYAIAKDILKSRYGRKERIIFTHIQQLMSVSAPGTIKCDTSTLWKLQDELLANIRSLEAFGITGDQYGVILTPLILSRLPQDIRLEWARDGEGRESDLEWLLKFLANETHRRERSQSFKDPAASVPASTCEERGRPVRKASASALHSSSTTTTSDGQVQCAVCNVKGHLAERCWDLSSLAMSERRSRVQQCGLCFRCLRKGHVAKGCDKCGGRHHVLLCGPRSTSTQHTEKGDPSYRSVSDNPKSVHTESKHTTSSLSLASSTVASSVEAHSKKVILQTAYVTVSGTGGRTDSVTVLFDTGSDRSYISSCSVKCVEPEWVGAQPIAYSAFGTTCGGKAELRNLFQVNLKCADDNYVSLLATEIPTICAPVYRPEVPLHVLQSFEGLSLTVDRPGGDGNQIDILIGLDAYWKFMKAGIVRGPGGLVAQESVFGWVLSGSLYSELESSLMKILGMRWSVQPDTFSFDGLTLPDGLLVTKRVVLSCIARLFDPLGFLTPFVMVVKCQFQEIWKLGLSWDETVPECMQNQFRRWLAGMEQLVSWQIPRAYTSRPWCENLEVALHAFGDASERGYGACVYLVVRFSDGSLTSSLVTSKARVAPVKKVTLPRLELLGALLCARLLTFVRSALRLSPEVSYRCWVDSTVALAWIQSDAHRWKPFVSNRVVQIQELTDPIHWSHCAGKQNPADLVTRGLFAEQLVASEMWLQGPKFLTDGSCSPEAVVESASVGEQNVAVGELKSSVTSTVTVVCSREPVFQVDRWGTFIKSIRIVAWAKRFIYNARNLKSERKTGELSLDELTQSKQLLILNVQQLEYGKEIASLQSGQLVHKASSIVKLSPFPGDDGLLRVGGRIQFAKLSFEEKHPIILPKSHLSLLLVRFQHRLLKHAGVATMIATLRCELWVVGLRRLAKQVKRECVDCQKQDSLACAQPMAPLPGDRVTRSPPFSVTGIDHAGPLYCSDYPKKKLYVLLFTCAVTRAVHLELVDSMSLADTMLALRRFFARRGLPTILYSDNAKSFIAAQGKLISDFGPLAPRWKFIVPRSPWWGGWWERLVKSVKSSLRKSLGSKSLTRSELETVLHEVEACLNYRPLTFVGDEVDSESSIDTSSFPWHSTYRYTHAAI